MKDVELVASQHPKLTNPVFVEGLPGIGNVGKLAVEHIIAELKATKFADLYAKDFPPQVFIQPGGEIRLVRNEIYFWKSKKRGQRDLILLTGDYQGLTSQGQYDIVEAVLDFLAKFGCKEIFTLGGYGMGRMVGKPGVLGAATSAPLVEKMKELKVKFRADEPGGGIIGASGLFLGMGKLRGMQGVCLMGETSGYVIDPKSARAVLQVLAEALGLSIGFDKLEAKAREMDRISSQVREMERKQSEKPSDEIRYIG